MAVDAVNGTNGTSPTTGTSSTASSGNSTSTMSATDFYKLLIAEMQYQDPTQPMDNSKIVEQVANIRNIESSTSMTAALQSVTRQQNFGTAAGLIGKLITGSVKDSAGNDQTVSGVVKGVRFESDGNAVLDLDNGSSLPLSAVTAVQSAPAAANQSGQSAQTGQSLLSFMKPRAA